MQVFELGYINSVETGYYSKLNVTVIVYQNYS